MTEPRMSLSDARSHGNCCSTVDTSGFLFPIGALVTRLRAPNLRLWCASRAVERLLLGSFCLLNQYFFLGQLFRLHKMATAGTHSEVCMYRLDSVGVYGFIGLFCIFINWWCSLY